jgi:hypothetical protein
VTTARPTAATTRGTPSIQPAPESAGLASALAAVEDAVAALGDTFVRNDADALAAAADHLQASLRAAMTEFAQVARRGTMSAETRQRFAKVAGRVTAQREALFRATATVDQALEILIPRPLADASTYSAQGTGPRAPGRSFVAN